MGDLDIAMEVAIAANPERLWRALTGEVEAWFVTPESATPIGLRLEPGAGGRFFRQTEAGAQHLWGFVQVWKPPSLLEIAGPLFFSAPVLSHLAFRIEPDGSGAGGSLLRFRHRAVGPIDEETRAGVRSGWTHILQKGLKNHVERHSR